jgi:DNA-binding PadR family transcriptional regulator
MSTITYKAGTMSKLGFALLGQLVRGDRTGYDLAQEFQNRLSHFWNAKHSQVYPELQKLKKLRFVTMSKVKQSSRPDKKVYAITSTGETALLEWVLSPLPDSPVRSELHLRTHSIHLVPKDQAIAFYETELVKTEAEYRDFEQQIAEIETSFNGVPPTNIEVFAAYANLKFGLENRKQVADWSKWLISSLQKEL